MSHGHRTATALFLSLVAASTPWSSSANSLPYPSLSVVEGYLLTTAHDSFDGHAKGFETAAQWTGEILRSKEEDNARAPHLVCTEYNRGGETLSRLQELLSPEAVRPVAHSSTHGACFFVTASHAEARAMSDSPYYGLTSISPFPSALKVAPGVLEHRVSRDQASQSPGRLTTTHGHLMRKGNVEGLNLGLSPGTLPAHSPEAGMFIAELLDDLMSDSIDLHSGNVWSDPVAANGEHLTTPGGAVRQREWSMAATLVHQLAVAGRTSPGDICSWDSISIHHAGNDLLLVSGLDRLLPKESGAIGSDEEATELRVACFMGLVSFLSSRLEVLRVSPRHAERLLNAVARTIIQSATITEAPLTAAGLDGTGQVIQVIDTGLDETSCFFIDEDGEEVPHGHYYEKLIDPIASNSSASQSPSPSPLSGTSPPYTSSPTSTTSQPTSSGISSKGGLSTAPLRTPSPTVANVAEVGDFSFYPDRRKVIQYINLVKADSIPGPVSSTSSGGNRVSWISPDHFQGDDVDGHGTHCAGSALGATIRTPAETPTTCSGTQVLGCVGGCIDAEYSQTGVDLDRLCPMIECDDATDPRCLGDDVGQTLADHGGMAQGAKLAFFDIFADGGALTSSVGNGLWEPCLEAGCKIHSLSIGADLECTVNELDVLYDYFMYNNPENLVVVAAGNDGDIEDGRTVCTMNHPAIGKNALAVGATSSGETRIVTTGADGGDYADGTNGYADVDTVAVFSSYGPTQDGRIKPEVVAPGDAIYSARSDGGDNHSCRLSAKSGTSMACPIVAGASAMVRQYFMDESFYLADQAARGWCDDSGRRCKSFAPSSATVKALLINSANLMGGSSEPDGFRGFGRIHLEMGMPLDGDGSLALFVADSSYTSLPELSSQDFVFDVDADANLDFRATLSWIDPPASSTSGVQLVHDLDLEVVSPSGATHIMWATSDKVDTSNVNERVIVAAADVESGTWTVRVSTNHLLTDSQSYSLVVNGAMVYSSSLASANAQSSGSTASTSMSLVALLAGAVASTIAILACAA